MYLGSAAAMLVLPTLAKYFGAASLLKVVGCLGLAWLIMWLIVGREIPHRCVCGGGEVQEARNMYNCEETFSINISMCALCTYKAYLYLPRGRGAHMCVCV